MKKKIQQAVIDRLNALNTSSVHSAGAEAEANMFAARRPFESDFEFHSMLYHLIPDEIKEAGKVSALRSAVLPLLLTLRLNSVARSHGSILQVLNTADSLSLSRVLYERGG